MSLISSSIPNFVNGVSQQPYTLRLSSQGGEQLNGLSTVSSGLRKRPPTIHGAKISSTPTADALVHMINRDGTERYVVILTPGDLKVYDLAGNAKTVNFTDKAYLNTALPSQDTFALTTVADYTYVVNRTKVAAMGAPVVAARPYEALFNVKLGNYGKTYKIAINGTTVASYATPDGSVAADSVKLATDYIATQLHTALNVAPYNAAPWTLTLIGSVIYLGNATADFKVSTEDGFSSTALVAIKDKLQKFTDLPQNPKVDGFKVEIVGDQASAFDNYWVRFDAGGSNNATGVWKESIAAGLKVGLDAATMPHQLIREVDGTFSFKPAVWTGRVVGDSVSNPEPSLVGKTINDVFFFQNRLGLLSDENYLQSETGKYGNFFRTTVVTLLDSDPLDVSAATNKVAVLEHAVSFNKQMFLFSRQQQFLVESSGSISPRSVPIKPATDFLVDTGTRPVAAGRNLYFTLNKGQWASVREYFADSNNMSNDANDITAHVPAYVPANVTKIAAGPSEDVLVLVSRDDPTSLYVYRYFFSGNEKLQSSWSRFSIAGGGAALSCDFIDSVLYLVVSRSDGTYFERMDFAIGAIDANEPYRVHLDRRVTVVPAAMTFDGTNTTIPFAAVGYTPTGTDFLGVSGVGSATVKPGILLPVTLGASSVSIKGDFTSCPVVFGQKYLFRYTLSALTIKLPATGGGLKSEVEGRTQVRRISFNHTESGLYRVLVTPEARQTFTYTFSGKILGSSSAQVGGTFPATGKFAVPVMSRNTTVGITVESDLPLPVALLSADWEAFYVKRSRPV